VFCFRAWCVVLRVALRAGSCFLPQGFVVIGVEHNDGTAAHAELPPRYLQSRPYEPLEASKKGKPRATYGVRSMNLLQRVREVLTAVDFVEALATIDQEPAKAKRRVVRSSGGRGQSAKDKRRVKEAEAAATAQSRERRKKQAGRAPPKAKKQAGVASAKSGRTKGAMIDAGSIPQPQVIEIGDDDDAEDAAAGQEDEDDDGESSSAAVAAAGGSGGGGSGKSSLVRREPKQRSLHARSVNKLRTQAQDRAKAGATARKSDPSQGAGSAVDRMQQVNKANEDGDVEMMVELLRNCADPSRVILMGHSFGGATALQAASARSRAFSAVVALDTWAAPIHHTTMTRGIEPGLPILALNCPRFAAPWNMRQLAPLIDPESRRAARARAEKHLAGGAVSEGLLTPRTEEEEESKPAPAVAGNKDGAEEQEDSEAGLPTPEQCNGIDPVTGTPVVPIAGPDAVDERCVADRTLAMLEGTDHQSFTDVELVSGMFGKLAKQSGEGPATENQRLVAKTVARWLLGRVLGKAPAAGDDAPSGTAMAHDSPAFELRAPARRGGPQAGRVPVSTAAVGGSASGTADAASDAVALVSKDTSGKVVRGLTEFGIGGDPCTWDPRIKPVDLAPFRK
jgi:pimeloyl-ACP methyl ester carboxylesterase